MPKGKKEESIREWFPRNLNVYMTIKGISKETMCERLNITRQTLNCWLRGRNPVDYIRIDQIAKVLKISPAQLMTPIEIHGENCTYIGEVGA